MAHIETIVPDWAALNPGINTRKRVRRLARQGLTEGKPSAAN